MTKRLSLALAFLLAATPAFAGELLVARCKEIKVIKGGGLLIIADLSVRDGLELPNEAIALDRAKNEQQLNEQIKDEAASRINKDTPGTSEKQDVFLMGCF